MKYAMIIISFLFMFVCGFILGGLFLMPYLPPRPDRPVTMFETAFWIDNWIGLILGLGLGISSARITFKSRKKLDA